MLEQLGPTYVKIGQMMASRERHPPARLDHRAVEAPEPGLAVRLRGRRRDRHQGAWVAARGPVRNLRSRPVRRGLDRAGPPGTPPRRDARRRQGPATADPGQDPGRPRRHPGARQGRRTALRRRPQGQPDGHRRRVRQGGPQGARLPQRGLPRATPGGRHAALPRDPCPARVRRALGRARHHDGVRQGHQDLEGG